VAPGDLREEPVLALRDRLLEHLRTIYLEKERLVGAAQMREIERMIMLQVIDSQWKDHLLTIDHLKEGIGLRGYAQKDPLIEYKKESYLMFEELQDRIDCEPLRFLYLFRPVTEEEGEAFRERRKVHQTGPHSRLPGKKGRKRS